MDDSFVKHLKNILFIDIETVSQVPDFELLGERLQKLWLKKASYLRNEDEISDADFYLKKAAIYAEFGKIICIGIGGIFFDEENTPSLRVKMIGGDTEADVLREFKTIVEKHKAANNLMLCAHNGKEFDFAYICRRMLVNGIGLPRILQFAGKKPWEINHLDTLDLWKFGDYKHYTGLDLLAAIFDIPSSKNDISGDQVNTVYHVEKDRGKIERYCAADVVVLTQLYMKMNNCALIDDENIEVRL
jgi:3'-5' exonuclease